MIATLLATWLLAPIAPLNPIEQDTVASIAVHLSAGISAPNGVVTTGQEFSAKYEMRVAHPFLIRGGIEYQHQKIDSRRLADGDKNSLNLVLEGLYYHGTNRLTGFLGVGAVYGINFFSPTTAALDSLRLAENVTSLELKQKLGFRFLLGLRVKRVYSLEVSVTELYPRLIKRRQLSTNNFDITLGRSVRSGTFRFAFGYIWDILP